MDEDSHLHIVVWLDFDVAGPVDIFLVNSRMPFDGFWCFIFEQKVYSYLEDQYYAEVTEIHIGQKWTILGEKHLWQVNFETRVI